MTVKDINIGDEIANHRVVFICNYVAKDLTRIYNFVGIDEKATYSLHRSDSSGVLYETDISSKELKEVILELFDLIKEETKLKHKPFQR